MLGYFVPEVFRYSQFGVKMGKCRFQLKWLKDYSWEQKSKDRKTHCRVCMKNIEIGGMGESALKSHGKVKVTKKT